MASGLHNFRGIILCAVKRYDEALAALDRSAQLAPGDLVPRLNLASAYLRAGRCREGEVALEGILREHPSELVARVRLEQLRSAGTVEGNGVATGS